MLTPAAPIVAPADILPPDKGALEATVVDDGDLDDADRLSSAAVASNFVNPLHPAVVPIVPEVKNYTWGALAPSSAVAALYSRSFGAAVDAALPYAELWIGTHESTPCSVLVPDEEDATLRSFIQNQIIMVDPDKVVHYSNLHAAGLPFLLKILSVAKPLSIQAHPNLKLAAELHENAPDIYPDSNHKPELTVAISPFQALCGFRRMTEIVNDIARVPEFAEACDRVVCDDFVRAVKTGAANRDALRHIFASLMSADPAAVAAILVRLVKRLGALDPEFVSPRDELLLHLNSHFPGDVGCFAAYFLRHVYLEPGQSVFIDSNEPHAYLSGDCVEIMATSDNVVRAGLTGKAKDVDTLVSMLSYKDEPIEVSEGVPVDEYATMYAPPVEEFMLVRYGIPVNITYELQQTIAPSVIVVLSGCGYIQVKSEDADGNAMLPLSAGTVYYLKAATTHVVISTAPVGIDQFVDGKEHPPPPICFFRAGVNEAAIPSRSNCSIM